MEAVVGMDGSLASHFLAAENAPFLVALGFLLILSAKSSGSGAEANLPNQLVRAALGYRMNLALVEKLLKEIGLRVSSPNGVMEGLTNVLSETGNGASAPESTARTPE